MSGILAKFLKEKRLAAGLSQRDVAIHLGYSTPQFISNWERGVSNPPISTLKTLGVLYRVAPEDLFNVALTDIIAEATRELQRKFAASSEF